MKKKLFTYARKYLPVIGIVVLILIIINLDIIKIKNAFLLINPIYFVFALSLAPLWIIIRTYSWYLILKEQKINLTFFQSLKIFLIGYFYGSITPGFLGNLMRLPYTKEKTGEPYGKLFVNQMIDSTLRTLTQLFMIVIGALLVISSFSELFSVSIVIFITILLISLFFIKKERGEKVFHALIKFLIPKKFKRIFFKFVNTFYHDFPKIRKLFFPLSLGLITWIIVFSQVYFMVIAIGVNIPYLNFILLYPLANFAGYLPISFAGLGTRELTSIVIFTTLFAVTKEEVLVFTLLGFLIIDIFVGFIGFLASLTESKKSTYSIEKILSEV